MGELRPMLLRSLAIASGVLPLLPSLHETGCCLAPVPALSWLHPKGGIHEVEVSCPSLIHVLTMRPLYSLSRLLAIPV